MNLIEIWGNTEKILYTISNKEGEIPRKKAAEHYAKPISKDFEAILSRGTIDLQTDDDLKNFVKTAQSDRYYGINFDNVGRTYKNTIEFRLPNGTIDADTWIENINLFGGIVKAAENLALIQLKAEEERTIEEQGKLDCLEKLKDTKITDLEKLEYLLKIVIPEENRKTYVRRYNVNSELLRKNPNIECVITRKTSQTPIDIKKIVKKILGEEEGIKESDYVAGSGIIEHDLDNRQNII